MQEEHVAVADGENEVRHTDYIYMVSDKMLVISMIAELDHHLADEMREVIDDVIDVRGVEDIIFDFSRINFMDSAGIGLIMGSDRILDMYRTAVNVTGDAVCTTIVAHQNKALDKNVFYAEEN